MRMMGLIRFMVIIIGFISATNAMEYHEKLDNPTLEEQARAIDKLLICQKCQGERLDESNSPFAQKIRAMIREDVKNKKSSEEIIQNIVQQHGQSILLTPEITPNTWILWWTPWLVLALTVGSIKSIDDSV